MNGLRYGPPFSSDVLADFHADALSDDDSAYIRAHLHEDPAAQDILAALDRVTADLGTVGRDLSVQTAIPPAIAARISQSLAAERERTGAPASDQPSGVVVPFARKQRRIGFVAGGVFAAAAAAIVAVAISPLGNLGDDDNADTPLVAQPTAEPSTRLDMTSGLEGGQIMALIGSRELGALDAPEVLAGCLQANGIEPTRTPLGSKEVHFDGRDGVLLILPGPKPPQLTALVVGDECGVDNADTITIRDIG
ncbi:MAG: hypothetical protein GX542_08635 [Rhodococcus sp.]|nr:hypothetical protein [Rhodococcus sp. (in: high G+C Gram-positive bacteria)]